MTQLFFSHFIQWTNLRLVLDANWAIAQDHVDNVQTTEIAFPVHSLSFGRKLKLWWQDESEKHSKQQTSRWSTWLCCWLAKARLQDLIS